jgi:uncharacterized membrane protein HdeD (DUF308 family)
VQLRGQPCASPTHAFFKVKIEDFLLRLARHRVWSLALGLIAITAGVLVLFWPRETVQILAVVFGARLLFYGAGEIVDSFTSAAGATDPRWLTALMGILSICVGILCLRNVFVTIAVIAVVVGIYLLANGLAHLYTAVAYRDNSNRWSGLLGSISILAGVALLAYPGLTLLYAAVIVGVFLVLVGSIKILEEVRLSRT